MQWIKNKKERPRIPDDKEERIIQKFLFFPLCIDNEYRWLEKVSIKQRYCRIEIHHTTGTFGGPDYYCTGGDWTNMRWAEENEV